MSKSTTTTNAARGRRRRPYSPPDRDPGGQEQAPHRESWAWYREGEWFAFPIPLAPHEIWRRQRHRRRQGVRVACITRWHRYGTVAAPHPDVPSATLMRMQAAISSLVRGMMP